MREATRRVTVKTPTINTDGGAQLLDFSQDLLKVRNSAIKMNTTRFQILKQIGSWAPLLLVYLGVRVGEETEPFLNALLLIPPERDRPKSRSAVDILMGSCSAYLGIGYARRR